LRPTQKTRRIGKRALLPKMASEGVAGGVMANSVMGLSG
jgi:hypothetical protein